MYVIIFRFGSLLIHTFLRLPAHMAYMVILYMPM